MHQSPEPSVPQPSSSLRDIRDYGAIADGKTDCSEAIQAALDEAAADRESVWVPEGVFRCANLRIPAYTGLVGSAIWGYRHTGGSQLELADSGADCLIDLTRGQGATIHGLSFKGIRGEGIAHGIRVDRADFEDVGGEDGFKIERCRINSFEGCGLYLNRVWCYSLRHCMISHCGRDGVYQHGWDAFLLDNWIAGNEGAGFAARDRSASCTFTGNRIEWNFEAGVLIRGGDHYSLTGNYFDRSGGPGLDIDELDGDPSRSITATGNVFFRNGKPDRCNGEDYASSHIRCRNTQGLVLSGNTFEAAGDDADLASGNTDLLSPDFGMVLGNLRNAVITGNVLNEGYLQEAIIKEDGLGEDVILRDNPGSPKSC